MDSTTVTSDCWRIISILISNEWPEILLSCSILNYSQGRRLRRREKLTDDQGQQMLAIDVFSKSIAYLKRTLLKHITDAVKDFRESDVHWVITVPAIWDDSAKQFMREAANNVISLSLSLCMQVFVVCSNMYVCVWCLSHKSLIGN